MKVLIISAFPPDPAPEANHALHMSEHLAKTGHTVHVLCKKGSIAATQQDIVVHPVIDDWSWWDLPRLAKCMKSCQPDIVLLLYLGWIYNHNPMITFLPTICKMVIPGVPCVTQFENIDGGFPRRSSLGRALRKAMALWAGGKDVHWLFGTLLRDSASIIVLSSPHRDCLVKHYPGVGEKSVILPPPPLIRFCPDDPATARKQARDAVGVAESDFVLVYWGYIYPGKGVETLLKAFRIVCSQNENMRLILVGGSLEISNRASSCRDYFKMVQQLPERLGIAERVTWTGHFNWDSDAGSRYLYAGDACVLPLDYGVTLNNSSLAAASTHGLPVIATELPMGRDEALEHGRNVYLCRPRDPEMLAEAIQLISENSELRERLREGILRLAYDWHSWDIMTKRLVDVLKFAVSSGEASGRNQSHFRVGGAESCKKKISSDLRPREPDHELPEVHGNNAYLSASIWSEENTPDNVNAPLVSVIVAAYNVEKYLRQCLDSLVNQTLTNIEIIVVNDASTDNSLGIIKEYQSRHHNVRVIDCKKNLGLASVRNLGMRLAKGTYIGFVDGDDWADPRKYELMYRRAERDGVDIVFAGIRPFIDDTKQFIHGNDRHIWDALSPELKQTVFHATEESRVFVIEPAVWAKLYKRSFLQEHGLEFEEGMNSVEDVIFHFAVLWKAKSISLLDKPLSFYRLNRPGQITGRTDRRTFETFTVFEKTSQDLVAWDVPDDIWASLLSTELRFFHWLFRDRVSVHLKSEFFTACAKQLRKIPERGFQKFARQANIHELARVFYMRRNWLRAYNKLDRWPLLLLLYVMFRYRRQGILKRGFQRFRGLLRRRWLSLFGYFANGLLDYNVLQKDVGAVRGSVNHLTALSGFSSQKGSEEFLAEVWRIDDQTFFFCDWSCRSGLANAVWRMTNDYYLSQTAVFRSGDIVVDVGAHVGVVSIYLARKYPFIKVYAIEPNPLNYACLKRNIELNGVTNVTAINKAVTGDGREATLYADPWDSAWTTIDESVASSKRILRTVQVGSMTLEQLFQEYAIRHCRLLKINALGAVRESLQEFTRSGCVDLLCGEVDFADCSRPKLEVASWRIARQHFWRTIHRQANGTVYSWIHQIPSEIERSQDHIESTTLTATQFVHTLDE